MKYCSYLYKLANSAKMQFKLGMEVNRIENFIKEYSLKIAIIPPPSFLLPPSSALPPPPSPLLPPSPLPTSSHLTPSSHHHPTTFFHHPPPSLHLLPGSSFYIIKDYPSLKANLSDFKHILGHMKSLSHYYDHFHDKISYLGRIIKFVSRFMEKLKELEDKIFHMGPFMSIQVNIN